MSKSIENKQPIGILLPKVGEPIPTAYADISAFYSCGPKKKCCKKYKGKKGKPCKKCPRFWA